MDGGLCLSLWGDAASNLEDVLRVVVTRCLGGVRCVQFSGDAGFESEHVSAGRVLLARCQRWCHGSGGGKVVLCSWRGGWNLLKRSNVLS